MAHVATLDMGITETTKRSIEAGEIHDILRNDRRRWVIKHLQNERGTTSLRDLSERLAELESGESPPPRNVRESVYNSLHQTHLPKLDDQNVIEYDDDRKTIRLREGASDVDVYMEVITRYGITWAAYYRTLGVLSLLLIVATRTDLPVVSTVPTLAWASGFLVLFAVSVGYQLWGRRWLYYRKLLS